MKKTKWQLKARRDLREHLEKLTLDEAQAIDNQSETVRLIIQVKQADEAARKAQAAQLDMFKGAPVSEFHAWMDSPLQRRML